jgi:hypothetical protein
MGMGQQQKVDFCWLEAEWLAVFFIDFATALIQAAVDQDTLAGALNQVAGSGYALVSTVE